ncbi:MAG: undecaprenyl-diphosphate phosphatase, partial [Janthinobacterium sp.]
MSFLQLFILSIVQGFAELLPVSSSAHVIMAE